MLLSLKKNTNKKNPKKQQQQNKQKHQQHIIAPVCITDGDAIRQLLLMINRYSKVPNKCPPPHCY